MAEKKHVASSDSSAASTCSGLEYDENESLSARNTMMVNNEWLSDVTFIVGPDKQRIFAHKLRLVTASKYFHILIFGNFDEAQLDEIELKDEDPEMFLTILRLIYGAQVDIDVDNIRDIYDRMQLYLLQQSCYKPLIDFLTNALSKDTVMRVLRENDYYKFKVVDEMCLRYLRNDPLYYFESDDFPGISEQGLLKIVGLQRINCTKKQLREALEKWKLANPESDSKELMSVIYGTIRTYMCNKVFMVGSINASDCKEMLGDFTLKIKSKPVKLYGVGVYLRPSADTVSVCLYMDVNGTYKIVGSESFDRISRPVDVMDLMFQGLALEEEETYKFRLRVQNTTNGTFYSTSFYSLKYEPFYAQDINKIPAIAHMWFNYSDH